MPRWPVLVLVAFTSLVRLRAASLDYSKEALVFENIKTAVHFSADGTSDIVHAVVMKIQSDGTARQFGILSLTSTSSEKTELIYVRVRKPDGKVIETPVSEAMDVASEVAQVAPMYSDLHRQQLPVKGLAVGDTLEFSSHTVRFKPEIPNQYWFAFCFDRDTVTLSQDLEVYTPAGKYMKVVSPFKPTISDEGSTRRYSWHYEQLKPTPAQPDKTPKSLLPKPADIQISTFRSWDELGAWYAGLVAPQAAVTPAIAAKAAEITKGMATSDARARALFEYVATKYRYISISFGIGRYLPHKAEEVIQNGYGDCKDKHTLLLALLKASGIDASTVLIGSGLAFDPDLPSPAQFNHVITAVPFDGHTDWLDTTAEVAPYGLLVRQIRDRQALVIDPKGKATIEKTPVDPPFSSTESIRVDSKLDKDGVLTGHFDMTFRGDNEMVFRALFHEVAPAQWPDMVQNFSRSLNFAGDVSNAAIENLNDLDKPLHLSYDYKRTNYSNWPEHRISPPLPPLALPFEGTDVQKPADDIELPPPGKLEYHAVIRLPKEYLLEPQKGTSATSPFGDYHAAYAVKDGVLTVDRILEIRKSKAPVSEWDTYRKLSGAIYDDHNQWMELTAANAPAAIPNNSEAAALIEKATNELRSQDLVAAKADLDKANKLAPNQLGLWSSLAFVAMAEGRLAEAATNAKKEIEYHPENINAYKQAMFLLQMQKDDAGAISVLQTELKQFPHQREALNSLAGLLERRERWADLVAMIDAESKQKEELDPFLQAEYASGLLRTGKKSEGLVLAQKLKAEAKNPLVLNNVAWSLAETETDLTLAAECADNALAEFHRQVQPLDLDHFETPDLMKYGLLSATWDTAGWVRFKMGKLPEAEQYANAAWRLTPRGDIADHLGQILLKEGKTVDAAKVWRMGLAADPKSAALRERLKSLPPVAAKKDTKSLAPNDQLNALRTIPLQGFQRDSGSAEYFLLFSAGKVLDERLVGGELSGSDVDSAIRRISYSTNPPGDDTKIIRKGILSCSVYTNPKCQVVLIPIQSTQK